VFPEFDRVGHESDGGTDGYSDWRGVGVSSVYCVESAPRSARRSRQGLDTGDRGVRTPLMLTRDYGLYLPGQVEPSLPVAEV